MDFELTDEQRAIRDVCREFAREVVAPAAPALDREHRFPTEIVRQMYELAHDPRTVIGLPRVFQAWGRRA